MGLAKFLKFLESAWPFLKEVFLENDEGKVDKSRARTIIIVAVICLFLFTPVDDKILNLFFGRTNEQKEEVVSEPPLKESNKRYIRYLEEQSNFRYSEIVDISRQLSKANDKLRACEINGSGMSTTIDQLRIEIDELKSQLAEVQAKGETYKRLLEIENNDQTN